MHWSFIETDKTFAFSWKSAGIAAFCVVRRHREGMGMRYRSTALLVSAILLHAGAAKAQVAGGGFTMSLDAGSSLITGHPYSAVSETKVTGPREKGRTGKSAETRSYRNSGGQLRYEMFALGADLSKNAPDMIVLIDLRAHTVCTLQPSTHTAYYSSISQEPDAAPASDESSPAGKAPDSVDDYVLAGRAPYTESTQELGMQIIQGLAVDGERTTRTLPAGSEGRDRPAVEVDEVWTSSELDLPMLAKHVDSDGSETVTHVTHLDRAEPAATLFQVPSDYTVQRETGAQ